MIKSSKEIYSKDIPQILGNPNLSRKELKLFDLVASKMGVFGDWYIVNRSFSRLRGSVQFDIEISIKSVRNDLPHIRKAVEAWSLILLQRYNKSLKDRAFLSVRDVALIADKHNEFIFEVSFLVEEIFSAKFY